MCRLFIFIVARGHQKQEVAWATLDLWEGQDGTTVYCTVLSVVVYMYFSMYILKTPNPSPLPMLSSQERYRCREGRGPLHPAPLCKLLQPIDSASLCERGKKKDGWNYVAADPSAPSSSRSCQVDIWSNQVLHYIGNMHPCVAPSPNSQPLPILGIRTTLFTLLLDPLWHWNGAGFGS